MKLSFEKQINLTTSINNPEPKKVQQLAIVHESQNGDISQYYIKPEVLQGGDKASNAIGVLHPRTQNTPAYYTYADYEDLVWTSKQGSKITRQRITRIGAISFPNVGAIAHYKLAYRNLSRIVAPVNYVSKKYKEPILEASILNDKIHVKITPPESTEEDSEDYLEYQAYRFNMVWNQFTLEYVSYELEFDVPLPSTTGWYSCYAIGYVNEGELSSRDSNVVDLYISGTQDTWPDVTPGSEDIYIQQMEFDPNCYLVGNLSNRGQVKSDNSILDVLPNYNEQQF